MRTFASTMYSLFQAPFSPLPPPPPTKNHYAGPKVNTERFLSTFVNR